jgi:hypothetical protein
MPQTLGSLSGLVIAPEIAVNTGSRDSIGQLSALMELWRGAKLVGPLVASRQQAVIKTFERRLEALLFGSDWAAAEARYLQSQKGPKDLKDLGSHMGAPPAFSFVIARDVEKFHSMPLAKRITELEALARRYSKVPHGAGAATIAISGWLDEGGPWTDGLTAHLSALRSVPFMLRAARLLSVATPVGSQFNSGEHGRQ